MHVPVHTRTAKDSQEEICKNTIKGSNLANANQSVLMSFKSNTLQASLQGDMRWHVPVDWWAV